MTQWEVNHYKFLGQAVQYKYRFPNAIDFKGIRFDPHIYKWFHNAVDHLKRYFIGLDQYRNIEDRAVLEKLVKRLKIDSDLKFLENPDATLGKEQYALPQQQRSEVEQDIASERQIFAQSAQAPATEAPISRGAPPVIPRMPTAGATSSSTAFQVPKIPPQFREAGKNLASNASVGLKRGLTKVASGFSGVLGGIARGGGNFLGGIAGGGGRALGGFGLRAIDATAAISQRASTGSLIKGPPKKIIWGIILGFIFLAAALTIFSPPTPPPGGGSTIPTPLDYKISFRDSAVSVDPGRVEDIKNLIRLSWPSAKLDEYWDHIVTRSIEALWNPAFVLALWIEETGASHHTTTENGGGGVPNSEGKLSLGHLGCAPWEDQTIDESLDCLFKFGDPYGNDQFQQFMEDYSSGPPGDPFANNPNFPFIIKSWYGTLIPEGTYGAAEPITTTPPPGVAASCPVPGGRITLPSYNADPQRGHCSPTTYGFNCNCGTSGRRAKAIDVESTGKDVILPTVSGQTVDWKLIIRGYGGIGQSEGGGLGHMFEAEVDGTNWYFDVLHMQQTNLSPGGSYPSETVIGRSIGEIIHTTIGTNIANPLSPGSTSTDCDPGWMPTDPICQ